MAQNKAQTKVQTKIQNLIPMYFQSKVGPSLYKTLITK